MFSNRFNLTLSKPNKTTNRLRVNNTNFKSSGERYKETTIVRPNPKLLPLFKNISRNAMYSLLYNETTLLFLDTRYIFMALIIGNSSVTLAYIKLYIINENLSPLITKYDEPIMVRKQHMTSKTVKLL